MKILNNGQAVILGLEKISLDEFPNLKVIGCNMTSTEHLPEEECEKRGIKIISLKGETDFLQEITSTAEHTIGLIIALSRNYKTALNSPYKDREFYKGHTLSGKTLGIIGCGRVGNHVRTIASSLRMNILGFDTKQSMSDLYRILEIADIVTIHIPLQGNEGFFTKSMFEYMKPTAFFINTSRGKIVENGALLWALENKHIAGAAIDFIDDPSLDRYARDNLIRTNHLGGATFEDMEKTENFITQKVTKYIQEYTQENV